MNTHNNCSEIPNYYVRADFQENVCDNGCMYYCQEKEYVVNYYYDTDCKTFWRSETSSYTDEKHECSYCGNDIKNSLPWGEKSYVVLNVDCDNPGEETKLIARTDVTFYFYYLYVTARFNCTRYADDYVIFAEYEKELDEETQVFFDGSGCNTVVGLFHEIEVDQDVEIIDFECEDKYIEQIKNLGFVKNIALFMYIIVLVVLI